ncbi:MAG: M3 family oligoendopeptidase [Candidatus Sumerlaeaceae bacterium]|nr:M3 family oligoendopeptidase [Candidatus Sumerlaeaceae bacterium]
MTIVAAATPREFPRQFLPETANLTAWEAIQPHYEELRGRSIDTRADLEKWLLDLSELQAAISEEYTRRYIAMTCHTDDPALEKAYLDYLENVLPKTQVEMFEINRKFLSSPACAELPQDRYHVYERACRNEVDIFREENVALKTEDDILAQSYQKIYGEMMVEFDGREQTMPQMARYQEETDRGLRERAWLAATRRQLADRGRIEEILDKMLVLRHRIAGNAGFGNFVDYQFRSYNRFDYTPADCHEFHRTVEKIVVPLRLKLLERRRRQLGIETLAPWDLAVDPQGRPPLRPFETPEQLSEGTAKIFDAVDPRLCADFEILRSRNLLDLDSRKGKAPGGYQSSLEEARLPFIFMNATGRNNDVFTLLHEGGHAFHALAARTEPLVSYRSAPIEFCEVASMGMEMMACEKLDSMYDAPSAQRAREMHIESVVTLLPWVMRIDAFQHWLYANPDHSRLDREQQWLDLDARFGDALDWSALPEWQRCSWYSKLHIFCCPLYYIEYAIAQVGALQLWCRYLDDPKAAVEGYRAALALGGSRPLPELFAAAGIRFAFDEATVTPLVARAASALGLE